MIPDVMNVGTNEIINTARLRQYLSSVGSPFANGADICTCYSMNSQVLGDLPYTTVSNPDNPAPWYDPDVPDSAGFLGLLPLSIEGLDEFPVTREVTAAVSGSGSIGPQRVQPRVITVTALVLGISCCGVEYGLHWLAEALQGCNGGACAGDCMTMYSCCPSQGLTAASYNARYRRTYRRVALTDGPRVTARNGRGTCGDACSTGMCSNDADVVTVEFTLTAGMPWAWTDPIPLLDIDLPASLSPDCVTWCPPGSLDPDCVGVSCIYADCPAPADNCVDPNCTAVDLPTFTNVVSTSCSCSPLAVERNCYTIDLSTRPQWASDVPVITVRAGTDELRNLTITLYQRAPGQEALSCSQLADANRCSPYAVWFISYIPPGGGIVLDGQIDRATLECGGDCQAARNVFGLNGSPAQFPYLDCAEYCLCVETDVLNPPGPNSHLSMSVSGRGL